MYEGKGSVPDVVWSLASRTAGQGHDVTVLERRWAGLPRYAEHEGVYFHRLDLRTGADEPWVDIPYEMVSTPVGAGRLLADRTNFAIQALRQLRGLNPDVIHVHLPFAANVVATLARSKRDRMVYTAHLGETEKRVVDPAFSPDVYLAKRVARTVALNPEMRDAFVSRGVPEERLVVVPNGVDIERFDGIDPATVEGVREKYGVNGGPVVLFVGTVTPRKGVTDLVKAASAVCDDYGEVQFLVVGRTDLEPDYLAEVHEAIAEVDIDDHVTLTGFVSEEELLACYDLADLFVLPSFEEGSSVAVTEAMAAGLPIVGSRIDGIRQQVEHGTHGLLFEPGDTVTLAQYIRKLVTEEGTRREMEKAIATRAGELSWEQVTDRMLDVYAEVET